MLVMNCVTFQAVHMSWYGSQRARCGREKYFLKIDPIASMLVVTVMDALHAPPVALSAPARAIKAVDQIAQEEMARLLWSRA